MTQEFIILIVAAAFFHTVIGPDHYLPFVMLSKAENWPFGKTLWITFLCGLAHTASSVVLSIAAIAFGLAITQLEILNALRGNLVAWMLIAFGLVYFVWGFRKSIKDSNSEDRKGFGRMVPGLLFAVFILGPCEALIPLLFIPAATGNFWGIAAAAGLFSAVTILTMMSLVIVLTFGINILPLRPLTRYAHALAGGAIFFCGIVVQFFGF